MSASVVDPRLRNWFTNTSHPNDQPVPSPSSSYNSTSYTQLHPNASFLRGCAPIYKMRTFHSTKPPPPPNSQLFGTSIFNNNNNSNRRSKNTLILNESPIACNINSPTPPLPHQQQQQQQQRQQQPMISPPHLSDHQISAIKHLITTLSIGIQEMNQYLDIDRGCDDHFGIHSKTTNCRKFRICEHFNQNMLCLPIMQYTVKWFLH